jgi:hypothetical protein
MMTTDTVTINVSDMLDVLRTKEVTEYKKYKKNRWIAILQSSVEPTMVLSVESDLFGIIAYG